MSARCAVTPSLYAESTAAVTNPRHATPKHAVRQYLDPRLCKLRGLATVDRSNEFDVLGFLVGEGQWTAHLDEEGEEVRQIRWKVLDAAYGGKLSTALADVLEIDIRHLSPRGIKPLVLAGLLTVEKDDGRDVAVVDESAVRLLAAEAKWRGKLAKCPGIRERAAEVGWQAVSEGVDAKLRRSYASTWSELASIKKAAAAYLDRSETPSPRPTRKKRTGTTMYDRWTSAMEPAVSGKSTKITVDRAQFNAQVSRVRDQLSAKGCTKQDADSRIAEGFQRFANDVAAGRKSVAHKDAWLVFAAAWAKYVPGYASANSVESSSWKDGMKRA